MKELLKFNLKRRYSNKMFIILNIILFVVIFILFHIDYLSASITTNLVYVDSSADKYRNYFLSLEGNNNYELSDEPGEIIIHRSEEKWTINSLYDLSEDEINVIKNDISKVIKEYYKDTHLFMSEYIKEIDMPIDISYQQIENKSDMSLTIISTISYFLIINFATNLANEVIYEKGTNFIKVLFTYVSVKKYLIVKLISSYLTPLIQLLIALVAILINMIIRFLQNGFEGLIELTDNNIISQEITINISISKIILIIFIIMSSLVLIQLIFMFISSHFTSNNQSSLFISIVYLCLLMVYFLIISLDGKIIGNRLILNILSYLPISSMIFMSERIALGQADIISLIWSIILIYLGIYVVIKIGLVNYKENMIKS